MKKIMFNDRYGLTQAVLEGRKTMTRRIVPCNLLKDCVVIGEVLIKSPYKVGEVVAVAQSYDDIYMSNVEESYRLQAYTRKGEPGWMNKMFVRADLMPHQIRITEIKVERLQDISDEDCLREGITHSKRCSGYMYVKRKADGYSKHLYINPAKAFAALSDKVSGKGTWERNPWVFAYTFELVLV